MSVVPFLAAKSLRFQVENGKLVLLWFGVYECENQGIFALTLSPAAFQHVCLILAVFMSELSHRIPGHLLFLAFVFIFLAGPAAHEILQNYS